MNVFITGASSGLGAALAQAYAQPGTTLGLVARRDYALETLRQQLPGTVATYAVDVTNHAALQTAAQQHLAQYGCPDIVIANAGISAGTLTECAEDLAMFDAIMRTNWLALIDTFQAFVPAMKQKGQGSLVGIASVAGIRGLPGAGAYSASKAAVITYLESLRLELAPHGIHVMTLSPGYIDTPMTQHNPYPMPFLMAPEKFAQQARKAIAHRKKFVVIPWQMGWVAHLLRLMPIALYDRLFVKAPRKPRAI